jgi:hypothetical protein
VNTPPVGRIQQAVVSRPRCVRCENPQTEPVTTMYRGTCDAAEWFRCDECEHIFSVPRDRELP